MTREPGTAGVEDGLDTDTVLILTGLARAGQGLVLGIAPAGRSGIKRISRSPGPEFRGVLDASFRARYPALVRHVTARVGDPTRAEDVVQQAFEKVWRSYRSDPREIHNIDAYVFTAVANEVNNDLRRLVARRAEGLVEAAEHLAAVGRDPQLQATDAVAVTAALAALAPREREAIVLRGQYDLSVEDTAAIMKLSQGAVKRYTADAARKLRAALAA